MIGKKILFLDPEPRTRDPEMDMNRSVGLKAAQVLAAMLRWLAPGLDDIETRVAPSIANWSNSLRLGNRPAVGSFRGRRA
jgi:hypothetical protein